MLDRRFRAARSLNFVDILPYDIRAHGQGLCSTNVLIIIYILFYYACCPTSDVTTVCKSRRQAVYSTFVMYTRCVEDPTAPCELHETVMFGTNSGVLRLSCRQYLLMGTGATIITCAKSGDRSRLRIKLRLNQSTRSSSYLLCPSSQTSKPASNACI